MNKFKDVLICTDIDGTLLKNDKTVSDENLEAIEYFKQNGGYFTFVTGRMPFFASKIYETVKPNVPVGCVNGGGLYDYVKNEYIYKTELSKRVIELIEAADRVLPNVGIQVNTFHNIYFCKENEIMVKFREATGVPYLPGAYGDISEPFSKIVFGLEREDDILKLERVLRSQSISDEFDFIRSEQTLFEILPKGVCKGLAVTKLAEFLGIDGSRTVAVGDYDNDVTMLEAAGIGIAVANASPKAKAAARFITVSNEEHAIARIIRDIEDGVYAL